MSATLTTIARTISEELERAVSAAEDATNAGLDLVNSEMGIALAKNREALKSAVDLEKEAAELISKAIRIRETAQSDLDESMRQIAQRVYGLRAETPRISSSKKSKALPPAEPAPEAQAEEAP